MASFLPFFTFGQTSEFLLFDHLPPRFPLLLPRQTEQGQEEDGQEGEDGHGKRTRETRRDDDGSESLLARQVLIRKRRRRKRLQTFSSSSDQMNGPSLSMGRRRDGGGER